MVRNTVICKRFLVSLVELRFNVGCHHHCSFCDFARELRGNLGECFCDMLVPPLTTFVLFGDASEPAPTVQVQQVCNVRRPEEAT
jgi:hypothetical protein